MEHSHATVILVVSSHAVSCNDINCASHLATCMLHADASYRPRSGSLLHCTSAIQMYGMTKAKRSITYEGVVERMIDKAQVQR